MILDLKIYGFSLGFGAALKSSGRSSSSIFSISSSGISGSYMSIFFTIFIHAPNTSCTGFSFSFTPISNYFIYILKLSCMRKKKKNKNIVSECETYKPKHNFKIKMDKYGCYKKKYSKYTHFLS